MIKHLIVPAALLVASALGGCAADGSGFLSTASITDQQVAAKTDPACTALASQIEAIRKDGAAERLEKAATGKTATVQVKRATLAKQTELNKLNTEFQAKCSTVKPTIAQAPVAPQDAATPVQQTASATKATAPATTKQ
jgi:hypothetical protein